VVEEVAWGGEEKEAAACPYFDETEGKGDIVSFNLAGKKKKKRASTASLGKERCPTFVITKTWVVSEKKREPFFRGFKRALRKGKKTGFNAGRREDHRPFVNPKRVRSLIGGNRRKREKGGKI